MKNYSGTGDHRVKEINRLKGQLSGKKKELTEIKRFLESAVNSIEDIIFYKDTDGIYLGCNKAMLDFLKIESKNLFGKTDYDIFPKKTADIHSETDKNVLESGGDNTNIEWVKNWKGDKRLYEVHKSPMRNRQGKIIGVIGVSRDITDRHFADEKFKIVQYGIDKSQIGVFQIDEKARIRYVNDYACKKLGYTRNELLKLSVMDIDANFDYPTWKKNRERIKGGYTNTFETVHVKKDGTQFPVEITVNYMDFEKRPISFSFARDITDEKIAKEALNESEERFRKLIKYSTDAMYLADMTGSIIEVNKRACDSLGYSKNELLKMRVQEIDVGMDPETGHKHIWDELKPGKPVIIESRHRRKDGTVFPVEISIGLIELQNQNVILGFARDISVRKKTETALIASESRFRGLIEASPDVIFITDYTSRMLYANSTLEKQTGLTIADFQMTQEENTFIHPDDAKSVTEFITNFINSKKTFSDIIENRFIDKYGKLHWYSSRIAKIEYEGKRALQFIARDITEIKKAEDALKYYTDVLEESQEVARIGHYILDINGDRWESSKMLDIIFGIKPDIHKNFDLWIDLLHPEYKKEMTTYFKNYVVEQKNNFNKEYKIIRLNDKKERWVHGLGRLEFDSDGTPVRMIGTIQDITERKVLEEQLIQSQKMEAIGQLAGGVAHDFNNMLTVINGYSELLLNKEIPVELRMPIQEIQSASSRATRLTTQLLAFSRKQIIQPKVISLNKLILDQIKMLRRLLGENVEISTLLDPDLKPVKADIGQMEQIVMNISINARDAMPLGGKLIIETKNAEFDDDFRIIHPEAQEGRYSMLSISDTGVGMDEVTMSRIFEPFYTTKGRDKGTGLGLATVYGIVKQNNGFIYVNSEIQQGSSFKIYFPSDEDRDGKGRDKEVNKEKLTGEEHILLVEDDAGVRTVTKSALENYGYKVNSASNGEEALRIYADNKGKFDLVLTDVVMPLMSGRELVDKIREQNSDIKILYFSGYTDDSIVHHGVLEEGTEFIQKPYSHAELAKKIRSVLDMQ